jgi:hypothetical protein
VRHALAAVAVKKVQDAIDDAEVQLVADTLAREAEGWGAF